MSFKYYNPKEKILGKTMEDHLRFAVCYWHTFKGMGGDPFGPGTIRRQYDRAGDEMAVAEATLEFAFEFFRWSSTYSVLICICSSIRMPSSKVL